MNKGDKRRYIRISTVLPIEFFIFNDQDSKITPWLQGFTNDIGKGGICLLINDLWWGFSNRFKQKDTQLSLRINLPFKTQPMRLNAKISWVKEQKLNDFNQYVLGLEFTETNDKKVNKLFKYALVKKFTPVVVNTIMVALLVFSFSLFLYMGSLVRKNRKLVSDYVNILEKRSSLEDILEKGISQEEFFKEKQASLEVAIFSLKEEATFWQNKYDALVVEDSDSTDIPDEALNFKKKLTLLELELARLNKENDLLKNKEKDSKTAVSKIQEVVNNLRAEEVKTSQKVINGMYDWIKNRQDLRRGLVLSYEGDDSLDRVCFTYDQALAALVFLVSGDSLRASKLLDFYLNNINKGQDIYNAYFTQGDVFEYVLHSGPNAWLGLAALCYTKETGDRKYLPIAKKVANFLLAMMDGEGGVKGGPDVSWYSTEHNLDVFAFFKLFYEISGEKKYLNAADSVKKWVSCYTYTNYGTPPIKRGKGDSTIATDTYAWSVTAFGPKELLSLKMNPESILEFAVKHCEIGVNIKRKNGEVKVRGFDFSKTSNASRGGVVSGEWTSQMILAFEVMADYFKDKDSKKSKQYEEKAIFYFNELQKMLITSPSRAGREDPCLPYASSSFVDTGHGWRTPRGSRTGSLASTAYFLLTYHGYNPLTGKFLSLSLKKKF